MVPAPLQLAAAGAAAPGAEAATQPTAPAAAPKEGKRPKTAFWLYQEDVRLEVAAELGKNGGGKLASAIAERWQSLGDAAKAKYVEKARELKAQYLSDVAKGLVRAPAAKLAKKKKKAAKAAKAAVQLRRARASPKRPTTSYSLWLAENRQRVVEQLKAEGRGGPSFEEVAKAAGRAWS